jgi:hypothetical protein
VVLFGGITPGGINGTTPHNDTWAFAGGAWTEISTGASGSPESRDYAAMTYDSADGYILLFGGYDPNLCPTFDPDEYPACFLGDTWNYSAGVWTQLFIAGPTARYMAQMTFDSEDGYVLFFSGFQTDAYLYFNGLPGALYDYPDTWSYSAGVWTNLTSSMPARPPGVQEGGLVDDTFDGYPLLWGGFNQHKGNDSASTWEYTVSAWVGLSPATSPPAEAAFAMGYDPPNDEVVLLSTSGTTWTY